jgi:sialic acid synthase
MTTGISPEIKIVAEIGCNHQGSFAVAKEMIAEAKRCGCDYVKLQKRHLGSIPQQLAMKPYPGENSFGATYLDHRAALELEGRDWRELQEAAEKTGIGFFGTAFDYPSAEFLCAIGVPYIKIGSGQARDDVFLNSLDGLLNAPPYIVSTGMCTTKEVVDILDKINVSILVHTTSSYPCPDDEINLKWLEYGLPGLIDHIAFLNPGSDMETGLSGHYTAGNGAIEAAAVALGVTYIERHFTLDRTWKGTDQAASLESAGMMNVVKAIRQVECAMGDGVKKVMPSELALRKKLEENARE